MGAPCDDPQGHGQTQPGPQQHTVHSPWVSLRPCRPVGTSLFRMYQELGDPLSCNHLRIGHPCLPTLGSPPGVESWSLCPQLSLASILSTISPQCCLCCHYCVSHPNTQKRLRLELVSHHSVRTIQSGSLTPGYPSGHQSSFSHRTHCGFFLQQRPVAMASAHGSQSPSSPLPQCLGCTALHDPGVGVGSPSIMKPTWAML